MELDFSRLNSLGNGGAPKGEGPRKAGGGGQATSKLQRKADKIKQERDRAAAVYGTYQENIKKSEQLQADILKGVRRGENIYSLFLKAVYAISLMTANKVFYNQIYNDVSDRYREAMEAEAAEALSGN